MADPVTDRLAAMTPDQIQAAVADRYGRVATNPEEKFGFPVGRTFAESVGYKPSVLDELPASMSESFTGAGNPQAFVNPNEGDSLLDLGCGAGLDLLLYARKVGPTGRVIGLDMACPMVEKARANLTGCGITNAEFLCAGASDIPLEDASVDLVTANGILNLSPERDPVIREAARVLKPGGSFIFAEIALQEELPDEVRTSINDWFRCIGGAERLEDLEARLVRCGFRSASCLSSGRNARTGHPSSICAVFEATR